MKIVGEVIQVPKILGLAFGTQNRLMVAEGQDTFLKAHNRAWSCTAGQVPSAGLVGASRMDGIPRAEKWGEGHGRKPKQIPAGRDSQD